MGGRERLRPQIGPLASVDIQLAFRHPGAVREHGRGELHDLRGYHREEPSVQWAPMTATVRLATEADGDSRCSSLAQAFEDDPVMTFLFPQDTGRVEKLRRFFLLLTRI